MWRHLIELSGRSERGDGMGVGAWHINSIACSAYLLSGHDIVGPDDGVQYLLQFHTAHGQVGCLGNALWGKDGSRKIRRRRINLD